MTTLEFFNGLVSPVCHKIAHNRAEYNILRQQQPLLIKATTFYQIYKHYVFGADGQRLTLQEFYRICAQYLYYDKYVCTHGTEFYYYVVFNPERLEYQLTKDLMAKRIAANDPSTLTDLEYIMEAV